MLNSHVCLAADGSIHIAMNIVNLGAYEGSRAVTQWYERNWKLFTDLQNICADGERVLVRIGRSHLKILRNLVERDGQMRQLPVFDGDVNISSCFFSRRPGKEVRPNPLFGGNLE